MYPIVRGRTLRVHGDRLVKRPAPSTARKVTGVTPARTGALPSRIVSHHCCHKHCDRNGRCVRMNRSKQDAEYQRTSPVSCCCTSRSACWPTLNSVSDCCASKGACSMNIWTAVFCDTALHEADLQRPACKRSSSLSSSDCWQVEVKAEEITSAWPDLQPATM